MSQKYTQPPNCLCKNNKVKQFSRKLPQQLNAVRSGEQITKSITHSNTQLVAPIHRHTLAHTQYKIRDNWQRSLDTTTMHRYDRFTCVHNNAQTKHWKRPTQCSVVHTPSHSQHMKHNWCQLIVDNKTSINCQLNRHGTIHQYSSNNAATKSWILLTNYCVNPLKSKIQKLKMQVRPWWYWILLVTLHHPGLTYIFNCWYSGTLAIRPWWYWILLVTLHHPGLTYIFNCWHSGTLALRASECQKLKMYVRRPWHWIVLNVTIWHRCTLKG